MNDLDVIKVFCAGDGRFGNLLGVVRDGRTCPEDADRQALAAELGYSETVFVDDPERGVVLLYTSPIPLDGLKALVKEGGLIRGGGVWGVGGW
ncbi:PhzF family phenazine biosynthesis protein, partial [Streptomyces lavendulae]